MSCMLRISGVNLNLDILLEIELEALDSSWRKGEPRALSKPEGKKNPESGASFLVSNAEFEEFKLQKSEAISYLNRNRKKIETVMLLPGVDFASLDFGIVWRDALVQCDYFPPELVKLAGELGLGIELSQYPPDDEKDESEHGTSGTSA